MQTRGARGEASTQTAPTRSRGPARIMRGAWVRGTAAAGEEDDFVAGLPIRYTLTEEHGLPGRADETVAPPRVVKMSESVAQDIVHDIVARGLGIGDRLPPEAAMLSEYSVSRESLREALRILEVQGLIVIRRGPGGGPVVSGIDPRNLARTSALYFHLAGATYDELFDTWQSIEPILSAKVAQSTDRGLVKESLAPFLEDFAPDVSQQHLISTANAFHAVIAELSRNRVLTLIVQAVSHIVNDQVLSDFDPVLAAGLIGHDHEEIAKAIVDGRATKARRLMEEHIVHISGTYRDQFPDRVRDLVEWR